MAKLQSKMQVNTWEADMLASASIAAKAEAKSGDSRPSISISGGEISVGGNPLGREVPVVLLDQIHANLYYSTVYDPKNPVPPDCFALATIQEDGTLLGVDTHDGRKEMAPHRDSTARQHTDCAGCQWNKYGSARVGDGKACQNTRRVAAISIGIEDTVEDIEAAQIAYLKVPATGTKHFSGFVSKCANALKRPTWALYSMLSGEQPSGKSYYLPILEVVGKIPDKLMGSIHKRMLQAKEDITWAYVPNPEGAATKAAPTKKRKYS
jgi:hypothetical protein